MHAVRFQEHGDIGVLKYEEAPEPEVQMIQSASLHLHKHFVGLHFWLRRFFVFQHINVAVLVESDCMHGSTPAYKSTIL